MTVVVALVVVHVVVIVVVGGCGRCDGVEGRVWWRGWHGSAVIFLSFATLG